MTEITYNLVSFEVKQFRSIKGNTGDIEVNNSPVAIIGVNESGKSNVIKALHLLTSKKYNEDRDWPYHYQRETEFSKYCVSAKFAYRSDDYGSGCITWHLTRENKLLHTLNANSEDVDDTGDEEKDKLVKFLYANMPRFAMIEEISPFESEISLRNNHSDEQMKKAQNKMLELFQVFEPDITLSDISAMFSETDSDEFQRGQRILSDLQGAVSDAIREIWGVKVEIKISPNVQQLSITVQDNSTDNKDNDLRYPVFLSERSTGFRWLFAWAVEFVISQKEKRNTVFLFDEPAIHLHPTAQEKFRDKMIELCKNCAGIIYTTHLPYIVNIENIENNYIAYREGAVSKITKINANAEKEARLVLDRALGISNKDMLALYAHRDCIIVGSEKAKMLMAYISEQNSNKDFNFPEIIVIDGERFIPSLAEIINMEREEYNIEAKSTICLFEDDDEEIIEEYKNRIDENKLGKVLTMSKAFGNEKYRVVEDILPKQELSDFLDDADIPAASKIAKNKDKSITDIDRLDMTKVKTTITLAKFKDLLFSASTNKFVSVFVDVVTKMLNNP